jgi:uncharacterized protein (TIGR02246 family)
MPETMSAREGIMELYARYPTEMDADNADEVADCFTEDGRFLISGQGDFRSHDAIKELVLRTANGRPPHITLNVWIREVDGDSARSQAYFLLIHPKTGEIQAYGKYRDNPVRCDDGRWRFKERRVQFEWTSEQYAREREPKAVPLSA